MRWRIRQLTVGIIIVALFTSMVGAGSGVVSTEAEANDNQETATPIGVGVYNGTLDSDADNDYYELQLEAGQAVNITVTTPDSDPFHAQTRLSGPETSASGTYKTLSGERVQSHLTYEAPISGTYELRVSPSGTGSESQSYQLEVESNEDRFEPNGLLDQAPQLDSGVYTNLSLLSNEEDYYALNLTEGQSVNITATAPDDAEYRPELELEALDGSDVAYETYHSASGALDTTVESRLTYQADYTGMHYLRVDARGMGYSPPEDDATTYTLSIDTHTDRFEPNGLQKIAPTPSDGTHTNLSLLSNEDDYYALNLTEGQSVNITTTAPEDAAYRPELELEALDGSTLESGDYRSPSGVYDTKFESRLTYEAEYTGMHYLRVDARGMGYSPPEDGATTYTLTIDTHTDRLEPNGILEEAPRVNDESYTNLSLLSNENDYYKLNLTEGQSVNITTTASEDADYVPDLSLEDLDGNYLTSDTRFAPADVYDTTYQNRLTYQAEYTGVHYLLVEPDSISSFANENEETSYDLIVETTVDSTEPDGTIAAATSLAAGDDQNQTLLGGEHDIFLLENDSTPTNVTVSFNSDVSSEINIEALNEAGDTLRVSQEQSTSDDRTTITLRFPSESETQYINLEGVGDDAAYSYRIRVPQSESDSGASSLAIALAGDDRRLSTSEVLQAVSYWQRGKSIPDTGGETLSTSQILTLISHWQQGTSVTL